MIGKVPNVDELVSVLGYGVGKPPVAYFKLPLGAPFKD